MSLYIEIEFFGAIGHTSEEHAIDAVKTIDSSYNDSASSIFSLYIANSCKVQGLAMINLANANLQLKKI